MKLPNLPHDMPMVTAEGRASDPWWLFFDSITRWIRSQQNSAQAVSYTQANLATLAAALKPGDAGLLVNVTDFGHILKWNGTAFQWAPGEIGSGYVQAFAVDPTATGWQLCDGTTVSYLKGDGTTGSYATPDLTSAGNKAAYAKLGGTVSGPSAAVAPTVTGLSVDAASTGITATTGANSGFTNITVSGSTPVASNGHTHTVSVTDPQHVHTLTGGVVGTDGEPRHMTFRPWFRQ